MDRDPAQLIDTDPSFFHQFTMIVTTQLDELHVARLARIAWEAGISFVVVRVSGFLGYLRIVTREHTGERAYFIFFGWVGGWVGWTLI